MFKKKTCGRCGSKVSDSYDFCPRCGNHLKNGFEEDWGMLGKNDLFSPEDMKLPMGFNMLFKSLVKNLNKEFSKMDEEMRRGGPKKDVEKKGISISISTSGDMSPKINVRHFGDQRVKDKKQKPKTKQVEKKVLKEFSKDKLDRMKKLKKEEPSTKIRRFSDRVVYEIDIPEVKSIDDVLIRKLQNSIEIKALTKDKVYDKVIPINLPIIDYGLEEGKLVLELGDKG